MSPARSRQMVAAHPDGGVDARGTGLYLHVPFCARRCHYCDFNTYAGLDELMPRYGEALRADLARVAAEGPRAVAPREAAAGPDWPAFTSVFVGGGTPTLLPAAELVALLDRVRDCLPLAAGAEITVEANPESVDREQLAELVAAGMTRVSIGAQSFVPHVLAALGRWHAVEAPLRAVEAAQAAGVPHISLDLIYGTPGESDAGWQASLRTALGTGVRHLSAYALTVEPNTEYARRVRSGLAEPPDDDTQAARMDQAAATLHQAGLRRYEISNWARSGEECRHNLTYWRAGNWLGVGAGAHGHWLGRRWWSLRAPGRYTQQALAGATTISGSEILDARQRRTERLLLGLRLAEGVDRADIEPVEERIVRELHDHGLLHADERRVRLTASGMRLANSVTVRLL